jgi:exodeoxyribonuclease V alpha subunit
MSFSEHSPGCEIGVVHWVRDPQRLLCVAGGKLPWRANDPTLALPWIEAKTGLALAPSQNEATRLARSSNVLVVTGKPGAVQACSTDGFASVAPGRTLHRPPGQKCRRH